MSEPKLLFDKFKLKANASFTIREGWLTKGLRHVHEDPTIFLREDATEILGIGSAMVKSMRYWMQVSGLTVEPRSGKRVQTLTSLGELIYENDLYFEDYFSLYTIHHKIVSDYSNATVWYMLFNDYGTLQFSKEAMTSTLLEIFKQRTSGTFSEYSFSDDCGNALRTYAADDEKKASPEENMQCPLATLDLISKVSRNVYECTVPSPSKLHMMTVLYIILYQMNGRNSISIERLLNEPCNVGKTLHLTPYRLNCYLDELQTNGYVTIQRTAGLNIIYPREDLTAQQVAQIYYRR